MFLFNPSPSYDQFKIFGCAAYPLLRAYNKHKFSFRTNTCVNLGLSPNHFGFLCFDICNGKIYVAWYIKFNEHQFPFTTHLMMESLSHFTSSNVWLTSGYYHPSSLGMASFFNPILSLNPNKPIQKPSNPNTTTSNHPHLSYLLPPYLFSLITLSNNLPIQISILSNKFLIQT